MTFLKQLEDVMDQVTSPLVLMNVRIQDMVLLDFRTLNIVS